MRIAKYLLATRWLSAQLSVAMALAATSAMAAGAVATSPDRSVIFWSTHKSSVARATEAAMGNCTARFGKCTLDRTFNSGCLGVARSPGKPVWGFAVRPSKDEARLAAIGQCAQNGASCEIKAVSCE